MLIPPDAPLSVPDRDRLGVLSTTLPVVRAASQAILAGPQVAAVAETWAAEPWPADYWDTALHFFDGTERTLNWMALLDALNFCFWGEPGQPRWRVHWQNRWYDGYDALAAALTRALDDGYPLWDAGFLMRLDAATLGKILRPDPDSQGQAAVIPLFAARLAQAQEVGRVLTERYGGQFSQVVASAEHDAVTLALQIANAFPSFDDVAAWEGREVRLLKRAQILVGDIAAAWQDHGWGQFTNLGELTAFADYKVPQLLRRLGILAYSPDLAERIDNYELIAPGSPDEVAIRAATVWGVEWLRQELAQRGVLVTAAAIDHRLWLAGQTAHQADRPYHRTRTIFY